MTTDTVHNFWQYHGLFFLFFITFFPRLTLLFSSVPFGGIFWWLGFFFAPRILVAILASLAYLNTNPVLVIISWVVALSGESGEKYYFRNRVRVVRYRGGPPPGGSTSQPSPPPGKGEVIEPEYTRIE